jgi:MFS family permease
MIESEHIKRSAWAAVGTVAWVTVLNPLNTSMVAVALPELRRAFGVSVSASTWLLSAFAAACALGHPLAGILADRVGPRRVMASGIVVTAVSSIAAAYTSSFGLLTALRVIQAIGTSTAYPAGLVILRTIHSRRNPNAPLPASWLGAIAMSTNITAALGPVVAGALLATLGWYWIFLVNVPMTMAGAASVFCFLPAERPLPAGAASYRRTLTANRALLSVYVRFAAVCAVFFSVFFAMPLWLEQERGLSAAATGLVMLPLVCVSALVTPVAVQIVSRSGIPRTLLIGAVGLVVGAGLLATVRAQSSSIEIVATLSVLGAPFSFNNLGLQAEMTEVTAPAQLGAAAGLFQTARFGGAALAGGLVGVAFAGGANTDGLRQLCVVIVLLSLMLFIGAAQKVIRPRAKKDSQSARGGKRETLENE